MIAKAIAFCLCIVFIVIAIGHVSDAVTKSARRGPSIALAIFSLFIALLVALVGSI